MALGEVLAGGSESPNAFQSRSPGVVIQPSFSRGIHKSHFTILKPLLLSITRNSPSA